MDIKEVLGFIYLAVVIILLFVCFLIAIKEDRKRYNQLLEYRSNHLKLLEKIDTRLNTIAISSYVKKERKDSRL